MDYQRLANLLFPDITTTPADIEAMYPPRSLPEGAKVTRIAPSPTGFMHLGNLFSAIVSERLAHQSGGVFSCASRTPTSSARGRAAWRPSSASSTTTA